MIKYRKKTTVTLLIAVFMISMFAVAIPVSAHSADVILDHTPAWNPFVIGPPIHTTEIICKGSVDFTLDVSGYQYVGYPLTLSGTVDMTAKAHLVGWVTETWACSYGDAKLTYGGSLLHDESSPLKWAYGSHPSLSGWWWNYIPNDQSQTWTFSFDYTPTQAGTYTLKAFGHADAGYYANPGPYAPHYPISDKVWLNEHAIPETLEVEELDATGVVEFLLSEGVLNKGQANSLLVKIRRGLRTPFENQVSSLCQEEVLTTAIRDWLLYVEFA